MPPHKFNKADRAKAAATRDHNREQKRLKRQQSIVATGTTELSMDKSVPMPPALREQRANAAFAAGKETKTIHTVEVFDWWEAPLLYTVEKLNNLKREYDRAAQIVLQRQSQAPAEPLHCWVWDNRDRKWPGPPDVKGNPTTIQVPRTAVTQCKRTIPDRSKAAFTNDGWIDPDDPARKVHSIYACSMQCYMAYNQLRPIGGLSRH